MRAQIRSFPIVAFLVLTYSLTWGAWGFGYLLIENPNLLTVAVLIGGFGPMVAAAIVVRATGESVREWLRTLLKSASNFDGISSHSASHSCSRSG